MLGYIHNGGSGYGTGDGLRRFISDRKLRLLACACVRVLIPRPMLLAETVSLGDVEYAIDSADESVSTAGGGPMWWILSSNLATRLLEWWRPIPPPALMSVANLLRDIVGNPFRPVVLPRTTECFTCGCPWLTPQVLSLAQAAYEERERRCSVCKGSGRNNPFWGMGIIAAPSCCNACRGKGWSVDGSLDPFRLLLVADALEEAGCIADGILSHLRSPGPHYRGMWSLDVLLGKE